jgi:DNA-binding NarL/FixJ family response regulator
VRVLVLTSFADEVHIRQALQAGAQGYLLKDLRAPELLHAIHLAAEGQMVLHGKAQQQLLKQINEAHGEPTHSRLTSRERDVLRLIVGGLSNKQIAYQLGLTEGTVKGYVSTILEKLGVEDRTQAALYAVKHGMA